MIKRFIALFIIVLAGSIFIAHTFIPHHHYQNKVCLSNFHCKANSENHNKNFPESSEEHNSNNPTEKCILAQIDLISDHQEKQDFKCFVSFDKHSKVKSIQPLFLEKSLTIYFNRNLRNSSILFLGSNNSYFDIAYLVLRGPPLS